MNKDFFRKTIVFFTFLNIACILNAQTTKIDTSSIKEKRYRGIYTIAPRVGIGFHEFLNLDLGISYLYIVNDGFEFGASSIYTNLVIQQESWNFNNYAPGFKVGFQNSWAIFMWGLEFKKIYANNCSYDYLSPKIGFSWMDVFNVEYAFNLIDKKKNYVINSTHQISINMSFNKKIKKEVYDRLDKVP